MKGFQILIFATAAVLTVCAAKPYDEKEEALREITAKFSDTNRMAKMILEAAENEKTKTDSRGESELLGQLEVKIRDIGAQLERDAKAVIRTAIIKAKPVSVIHCIRNVTLAWSKVIEHAYDQFWEKIVLIRLKKMEKIDFDIYAIKSIMDGLKDLVDQSVKKINEGGLITANKKEAINNCHSADLLLGEIEVCLHEPILSREYIKMRQEIDRGLAKIKAEFNVDLEKCLSTN